MSSLEVVFDGTQKRFQELHALFNLLPHGWHKVCSEKAETDLKFVGTVGTGGPVKFFLAV